MNEDDLPQGLLGKLVRVANRGRFSHVVPPRVWQSPVDGRVLQVLDNSLAPISMEMYAALVEFERGEMEKGDAVLLASSSQAIAVADKSPPSAPTSNHRKKQRTLLDMFQPNQTPSALSPDVQQHIIQDSFLRYRSFVFPRPSNNKATSTITTDQHVIYWVRMGCVRMEHNFVLDQALWMRNALGSRITAVCFAAPAAVMGDGDEQQDYKAFRSALVTFQRKLQSELGIQLFCLDATEQAAATAVLALWCRHVNAQLVLTTDLFLPQQAKTAVAVSRAIPCPLVAFDSENASPMRTRWSQPPPLPPPFSTIPRVFQQECSVLPPIVSNRWNLVEFVSEEKEEEGDKSNWDKDRVLASCRIGTVSALHFTTIPPYLAERTEQLAKAFRGS
ncbi:hypothetical protein BASA81_008680 [Batrachochytrium salamandrivorans]|nr:hypothetical protein BASA81_008680 [Batrachochytrium salamandrivorans]